MINAYFDDSGTHETSTIVLVAGLMGTEGRLRGLDRAWKKHVDNPLDGAKPPLRRFHASDCFQSQGEFAGWKRVETDYFRHQLRKVIIDSGVSAYAAACLRKDWDELVIGDMRSILGTAEGFCIRNCFVKSLAWIRNATFDPEVTFVFDNRPSVVKRDAHAVFDAYQKQTNDLSLVGISFLSSYDIRPLQAADMLAWEFYQYANDLSRSGDEVPQSDELKHLTSNMSFAGQYGSRASIEGIVDLWNKQDPDNLRQVANHFSSFDPANPDYSNLVGIRPRAEGPRS